MIDQVYVSVDLDWGIVIPDSIQQQSFQGKIVLADLPLWERLDVHQRDFLATKTRLFIWEPRSIWEDFVNFRKDFPGIPIVCVGSKDIYDRVFEKAHVKQIVIRKYLKPQPHGFQQKFGYPRQRYHKIGETVEPGEYIEETYTPKTNIHNELGYLRALASILMHGRQRSDRTGTGTVSTFGTNLEFDLRTGFPLLTTKKMFWKGIVEELLMFLRGETQTKVLESKGVGIWKGNTSREFQKKVNLGNLPEGDMGKMYGYQWRMFNDKVDQIGNLICEIKKNPDSRRLFVSAWNPCQLQDGVLPPCHVSFQIYVDTSAREMDLHMYQRSADMFLGVPFNIASYALLLTIFAKVCGGYTPRKLFISMGDSHIYKNHIEQVKQLLSRKPLNPPVVHIDDCTIDTITAGHIHLVNYESHGAIKADMAV